MTCLHYTHAHIQSYTTYTLTAIPGGETNKPHRLQTNTSINKEQINPVWLVFCPRNFFFLVRIMIVSFVLDGVASRHTDTDPNTNMHSRHRKTLFGMHKITFFDIFFFFFFSFLFFFWPLFFPSFRFQYFIVEKLLSLHFISNAKRCALHCSQRPTVACSLLVADEDENGILQSSDTTFDSEHMHRQFSVVFLSSFFSK